MSRWWRALRPVRPEEPDAQPPPERADPSLATAGPAPTPARPSPGGQRGRAVVVPVSLGRHRPLAPSRDIELSHADHGRTVETRVGEEFLLRLPENHAGYAWQFTDPVDHLLAVVGSSFEGAVPSRPGSGGHLVMRLRGRRQGSAILRLALTRLWGGEPINTFEVTVRVVEQGGDPHGLPH